MTDKWTPGPWIKREYSAWIAWYSSEDSQWSGVGVRGDEIPVALVTGEYGDNDRVDANRALIAAAPDMAEALKPLERMTANVTDLGDYVVATVDLHGPEIAAIRAALAKARSV